MKYTYYIFILFVYVTTGCKEKKETSKGIAISVVSIIKGQVNHLDTSLYQIMKYETKNSKTDTSYLKREEVRGLANSFLNLPDISKNNYEDNYTEERLIDQGQNTLSIIATAKNEKLEIQKQIIIVPLDELAAGKVQSIYIDRFVQVNNIDTEQKLFWQVDKFFQAGNIIQAGGPGEKTEIIKVTWQ